MRRTKLEWCAWLACALAIAACSGSDGATSTAPADANDDVVADASDDVSADTLTASDAGDDAAALGPYPAGPYGTNEGNVLADLQWEGYVDETGDAPAKSKPYGATSMGAIRSSGRRYALVHLAEFL
jgi:hypothetical protein